MVGINISPPPLERVLVVNKGGVTYGVTADLSQILPKTGKNRTVFPILQNNNQNIWLLQVTFPHFWQKTGKFHNVIPILKGHRENIWL